jgi:hypothetical protein
LTSLLPKYFLNKNKTPEELEQKITSVWNAQTGKQGTSPYEDCLEVLRKQSFYGSTFFPCCKNMPPQGHFEKRTDHLLLAVSARSLAIIDEGRFKLGWSGEYMGIEWEASPDSVLIEYTPPNGNGKRVGTTLITPQAHLIDSLASRAIYNIERATRRQKRKQIAAAAAKIEGKGTSLRVPNNGGNETVRSNRRKLSLSPVQGE